MKLSRCSLNPKNKIRHQKQDNRKYKDSLLHVLKHKQLIVRVPILRFIHYTFSIIPHDVCEVYIQAPCSGTGMSCTKLTLPSHSVQSNLFPFYELQLIETLFYSQQSVWSSNCQAHTCSDLNFQDNLHSITELDMELHPKINLASTCVSCIHIAIPKTDNQTLIVCRQQLYLIGQRRNSSCPRF